MKGRACYAKPCKNSRSESVSPAKVPPLEAGTFVVCSVAVPPAPSTLPVFPAVNPIAVAASAAALKLSLSVSPGSTSALTVITVPPAFLMLMFTNSCGPNPGVSLAVPGDQAGDDWSRAPSGQKTVVMKTPVTVIILIMLNGPRKWRFMAASSGSWEPPGSKTFPIFVC